jgi:hypothetical protein
VFGDVGEQFLDGDDARDPVEAVDVRARIWVRGTIASRTVCSSNSKTPRIISVSSGSSIPSFSLASRIIRISSTLIVKWLSPWPPRLP